MKMKLEAIVLLLATGWLCLSKPTGKRPLLLPPSLTPESYELSIDPDLWRGVFHGVAVVQGVAVTETSRVSLHCSHLLINTTLLSDLTDGTDVGVVDFQEDTLLQQCHLGLNSSLRVDHEYRLTVEYVGVIGKEATGLYRDYYREGGERHSILMTHMQPNYARTVFPCWDEPHYKAQFVVKVSRRIFPTVLSNMPAVPTPPHPGWVEFEETPPMSTYLLAIVWCDYAALSDPMSNNSVWAPRDRLHEAQLALNVSMAVVDQCSRYFGREYPLPKLDHIPLPSIKIVGMENWGAITYELEFVLWEEGVSTWAQREMTTYVVCHEVVHQWLGNLVTTAWWNTTWLNEGVTSFFHHLFIDKIEPSWNAMDTTFVTQIQEILIEEATRTILPLTNNEPMAQDIIVSSAFSATTYLKGAAILRMVYNLMPPDVFREAIAQYVLDNQFGSVDEADLWQSLSAVADLPVDLEAVMFSWTHQLGFPLVTVHRSPEGCVTVRQVCAGTRQEKYAGQDESDIRWTIPITYTTSDELDFNISRTVWFPDSLDSLALEECLEADEWVIVNIRQSGFYRVNYDLLTWEALTHDLLHCDLSNIHPVNRAQLLCDGFDLARHGLLDYRIVLNLSRYLKRETEYLPWFLAIQNLNTLRLQLHNSDILPYFESYALDLVDRVFLDLSLSADLGDLLQEILRKHVTTFACSLGHPRCVREATVTAYLLMSGVHVRIPVDLKPILLCTAVRHGQSEVWHYVLKQYHQSSRQNERWRYLSALACTNKTEIVDRMLKELVNPSFIHSDDRLHIWVELGKQSDNLGPMLDLTLERFHQLSTRFNYEVILDVLKTYIKPYITPEQKDKVKRLADLVNQRNVPKEMALMEAIMVEMMADDFIGLNDANVREWFIQEAEKLQEEPTLTTSHPPTQKSNVEVKVDDLQDLDEDLFDEDEEDFTEETTTKSSLPSNTSSSNTVVASKLSLTFLIVMLYSML